MYVVIVIQQSTIGAGTDWEKNDKDNMCQVRMIGYTCLCKRGITDHLLSCSRESKKFC